MTMQQIAELAGVHKSTVDKVIHNRPGVSDAVREKITKLLEEYNYKPNRAAQALNFSKTDVRLGIILVNVDAQEYLINGINSGLKEYREYNVSTEYSFIEMGNSDAMERELKRMAESEPDGVILSPVNADKVRAGIKALTDKNIPVITVNADISGTDRLCFVGQDGVKAGRTAARLMAEVIGGEGNVAIITSAIAEENNNFYVKVREEEFTSYLKEFFPEIKIISIIESFEKKQITREKTEALLDRENDLDGIYITCGGVADVAETVKKCSVKNNLKIIGYEGYRDNLELMKEGVVTILIDGDIPGQGYQSVSLLMDYIINNKKPSEKQIFTNSRILIKELV